MSRKTKLPTRRRTARSRILAALVMLLFTNQILHTGYLLPRQVLWEYEEKLGAGHLWVIDSRWEPAVAKTHGSCLVYLAGNAYVTVLKGMYFSFAAGWTSQSTRTLLCDTGESLYVKEDFFTCGGADGENRKRIYYLFGRVDDPDIQRLEFEIRSGEDGENTTYLTSTRSAWMTNGESAYFLVRQEFEGDQGRLDLRRTIAYDETGRIVTAVDGDT